MHKKLAGKGAILACVAALLAGCGSSSSNSSSSGGSSSSSGGTNIQGGPAVTPAMASNPSGNVTWCIGKDTTGAFSQVVKLYEQSHPNVHVKLLQLPVAADQQRTQLIQREQAKSPECDILGMDVIWTAEFAGQGWLHDVTPAIQARQSEFIPSTLNTVKIGGKDWAVPFNTNAGLLFYNKTKVHTPPTTWQQAYQMAKSDGGIGYQGSQYEGLTVELPRDALRGGRQRPVCGRQEGHDRLAAGSAGAVVHAARAQGRRGAAGQPHLPGGGLAQRVPDRQGVAAA